MIPIIKIGVPIFIGLLLCASFIIPIEIQPLFNQSDAFIPRKHIKKTLNHRKNIRLIQMINWPIIQSTLLEQYPMIDSIQLNLKLFPKITVKFNEKSPWLILIKNDHHYIFSDDGTQLNIHEPDIELPNNQVLIVQSDHESILNNRLSLGQINYFNQVKHQLHQSPLLKLQQVIIQPNGLEFIDNRGFRIILGDIKNLEFKFKKLNNFLSFYYKKLVMIEYIDLSSSNKVVIK